MMQLILYIAVMAAVTSGGALIPSCIGTLTAVILAWRGKSLLMVAAAASLAVYLAALFC